MSPATVTIDTTPDFSNGGAPHSTLLLAPPAMAAQQDAMAAALTDAAPLGSRPELYMLDRLAAGLTNLAPAAYDLVLVLASGADPLLSRRDVFAKIADAMKPGAKLRSRDGSPLDAAIAKEAILAGLVESAEGAYEKPAEEVAAVPLKFLKKKNKGEGGGPVQSPAAATQPTAPAPAAAAKSLPNGVVMVDLNDDFDVSDDEMIDEDELMTEEDLMRPIQQRTYCLSIASLLYLASQLETNIFSKLPQPPSVPPSLERSDAHAKTARAAWPSASRPKTRRGVTRPTSSCKRRQRRPSSSLPRTSTSSTLRCRARRALAAAAPSATPSAVQTALISASRRSNPARR